VISSENIYLIGPMGAGKSSIGKQLAVKTKKKFVDSDAEIEKRTGAKIDLIFEIEGESGFRKREIQMIDELTSLSGIVLATGGGVVLMEQNRINLKKNGIVIYLKASPDLLMNRTEKDRNRPLLQTGNRLKTIKELLEVREPLYEEIADFIIDTDGHTVRKIVNNIQLMINTDA
jgi:shikimate kinase